MLQILRCLEECAFELTPRMCEFARKACTRMLGSQLIEDGFNEMKATSTYANRKVAIEGTFGTLVARCAISTKHSFKEVDLPQDAPCRDAQLPSSAYQVDFRSTPPAFKELTSFVQKTTWPTVKPEHWGTAWGDLRIIEYVVHKECWRQVENAFFGACFDCQSSLLFRRVSDGQRTQWLMPLGHFPDSAAIGWPCKEHRLAKPPSDIGSKTPAC